MNMNVPWESGSIIIRKMDWRCKELWILERERGERKREYGDLTVSELASF